MKSIFKQTARKIVKVHAAAGTASKAYNKQLYVSQDEFGTEGKTRAQGRPTFTADDDQLMDHYANTMNWKNMQSEQPNDNRDALSDLSHKDDLPSEAMDTIRNAKQVNKKRPTLSEFEHTGRHVRSNNLISLFYDQHDLDSYIA